MVIDENDAFQLFQGIETMPEDMRPRAASLLADYKAQQESLGASLWPTQEKLKHHVCRLPLQLSWPPSTRNELIFDARAPLIVLISK